MSGKAVFGATAARFGTVLAGGTADGSSRAGLAAMRSGRDGTANPSFLFARVTSLHWETKVNGSIGKGVSRADCQPSNVMKIEAYR